MMSISIRSEIPRIDGKSLAAAMDKELYQLYVEAARAFLVATVRRIPVRTGFLRGAFSTLEDVIGQFEATANKTVVPVSKRGRGTGIGSRPGRNVISQARKLVRARRTQNKLLQEIRNLKQIEKQRAQAFYDSRKEVSERVNEIQGSAAKKATLAERFNAIGDAKVRAEALADRRLRRRLIRDATKNEENINKLVEQLEKRLNSKLVNRYGDHRNQLRLRLEKLSERRERTLFRVLKNLDNKYLGKVTIVKTPTGKLRTRTAPTITGEDYKKRLKKLRQRFFQRSKAQKIAQVRLQNLNKKVLGKINPQRLQKIRTNYFKHFQERADELEQANELKIEISERAIQRQALVAANRHVKREAFNQSGSPVVALAQYQLATERRKRAEARGTRIKETMQLAAKGRKEPALNFVTRVKGVDGRIRIVGQNVPGKFNLHEGDVARGKPFRLVEFYYPNVGTRTGRIQKGPRSGRLFSTAPSRIITRIQDAPRPNAALFQQLVGALKATGKAVPSDVLAASQDFKNVTTQYIFEFSVNIRYLPVNDLRLAWGAWNAGILAFNQYITANLLRRIPKIQDYMLTEVQTLNGKSNQRSRTVTRA